MERMPIKEAVECRHMLQWNLKIDPPAPGKAARDRHMELSRPSPGIGSNLLPPQQTHGREDPALTHLKAARRPEQKAGCEPHLPEGLPPSRRGAKEQAHAGHEGERSKASKNIAA